jgi:hypothetical protein
MSYNKLIKYVEERTVSATQHLENMETLKLLNSYPTV